MAVTPHSQMSTRRYGPHAASIGLLLILISIPADLVLPVLADHAPSARTATDLRQLSAVSVFVLLAGIVLCLRGLLTRRDASHRTVSWLGLIVATLWIGLALGMSFAL